MTRQSDPPLPEPASEQPAGDAEAARLLEVGLSGGGAAPRRTVPTPEAMSAHFPDLEVLEVLGQGGMGVVYLARQRRLDRRVALKVLPRELSEDPAFAERFTREARTLARLQHPHIVGVHEFGERDGLYFLIMEYVDGVTLRQLMSAREISPREALAIVPQICAALQYAHDQGIVHRDVKPENILLDRAGRVKVADFGLAKLVRPAPEDVTLTGTDQVMGTLHYMAPEQYKTPRSVDHRADIFSLGVVFYEMLTGELPVGRFDKPTTGTDVDARIDEIVLRTLERERDRRYQRASDVEGDVKTVTDATPPAVDERAPRRRADRPHARHGRGSGRRPMSRWTLWALLLLPIGTALGFFTYGLVYNFAGGEHSDHYARVGGLWVGLCVGCLAFLVSFVAILRTHHARTVVSGLGLSVTGLVLAMLGTTAALTFMVEETNRHARSLRLRHPGERPLDGGGGTWGPLPTARFESPVQTPDAAAIRAGIQALWTEYAQRSRGWEPWPDHLEGMYAPEGVEALQGMLAEEVYRLRAEGRLGMAMMGPDQLRFHPKEFGLSFIRILDTREQTAEVTVVHRNPTHRPLITFPVVRRGEDWYFAVGDVRIEE